MFHYLKVAPPPPRGAAVLIVIEALLVEVVMQVRQVMVPVEEIATGESPLYPRFVRAEEVEPRSERLLTIWRYSPFAVEEEI